ncbi:MerR family transcriptional regulator [Niallia taxi]|uniref:MerR family transcriptional regulator n=1 Tax=Niallia taxi TaxID=2499688 RepID=A0A3S2UT66_9BACI|nr:MerR family transcriptional regulator [Niallia taxi]RVT56175.1 MerR family transcriptional regulator [Niallia taxi]
MYSIKEVESMYGLPSSTLRYYEKEGILPKIHRDNGGRRKYTEEELEWLQLVIALRDTGMSMEEIKRYVDLVKQGDKTLEVRRSILLTHKESVEKKMDQTLKHLEKINRKMAIYDVMVRGKNPKDFLI